MMLALPTFSQEAQKALQADVRCMRDLYQPDEQKRLLKEARWPDFFGALDRDRLRQAIFSYNRTEVEKIIVDGFRQITNNIWCQVPLDVPNHVFAYREVIPETGEDALLLESDLNDYICLSSTAELQPQQRRLCRKLISVLDALDFSPMRLNWTMDMFNWDIEDLESIYEWLPSSLRLLTDPKRLERAIRATARHKTFPLLNYFDQAFEDPNVMEELVVSYALWMEEQPFLHFLDVPNDGHDLETRINRFVASVRSSNDPRVQAHLSPIASELEHYLDFCSEELLRSALLDAHIHESQNILDCVFVGSDSDFSYDRLNAQFSYLQETGEPCVFPFPYPENPECRERMAQVLAVVNLQLFAWQSLADFTQDVAAGCDSSQQGMLDEKEHTVAGDQ